MRPLRTLLTSLTAIVVTTGSLLGAAAAPPAPVPPAALASPAAPADATAAAAADVVVAHAASGKKLYFPDIIALDDGRLLAAYYEGSSHVGPDGKIFVTESSDAGRTWSAPRLAVETPYDDRDPKLAQLSDGTILLSFFETDWSRKPVDLRGTHVVRSEDAGATWSDPVEVGSEMDCGCGAPYGVYGSGLNASHGAVTELADGDLLIPLYGVLPDGTKENATVVRSTDGGRTWPAESEVTIAAGSAFSFQEPTLTVLDSGEIVALIRTTTKPQLAYISRSSDDGATWTPAQPTDIPASSHHLLPLTGGGILLTYGDVSGRFSPRRATSGRIVEDPAASWDGYTDIPLYDSGNSDQANPSSAEAAPGLYLTLSFDVVNATVVGVFRTRDDYTPCTTTVTGSHPGPLSVTTGKTCVTDAVVTGPVSVAAGAALRVDDSQLQGPVRASGASAVTVCGSDVGGPIDLGGGESVTLGHPDAGCASNTADGPVQVTDQSGLVVLAGNTITGPLACSGNDPAPVDAGHPNSVEGPVTGQCEELS